jgi:hypothetical protein
MDSKDCIAYLGNMRFSKYSNICVNLASQLFTVGKGDYGTAFRLNDGHIVKVFKSHDLAYLQFLNMVMLTNSKHLPNIYCFDIYTKFGWVILEFLDEYSLAQYLNLSFKEITVTMSKIIRYQDTDIMLPESLHDLAIEMRETAQGYCLDFKEANFACRSKELIIFDPYTNKTATNDHLDYVEKRVKPSPSKQSRLEVVDAGATVGSSNHKG